MKDEVPLRREDALMTSHYQDLCPGAFRSLLSYGKARAIGMTEATKSLRIRVRAAKDYSGSIMTAVPVADIKVIFV